MAFDLESYLAGGVERMVRGIARAAAKNPRTARFMAEYALTSRRANRLRLDAAARGEHVPPFLIASITTRCNLHCKGCYARANHNCTDSAAAEAQLLSPDDWTRIFDEAAELGLAFILLAGGEPFMRPEVLRAAGRQRRIIFPVFTNGTMLSGTGLEFVREHPNLMPVLSIEGGTDVTDARRGCKVIIYVEYVPVDRATEEQAPGQAEREYMAAELSARAAKLWDGAEKLEKAVRRIDDGRLSTESAVEICRGEILPEMETLREISDGAELIMDRAAWPYPSYGEILTSVY